MYSRLLAFSSACALARPSGARTCPACAETGTFRMRNVRSTLAVTCLVIVSAAMAAAAKPGWLTDYTQAQGEAKAKKKLLLMDFTGSDWCGWCMRLDREVFSQPEFQQYAEKHLVLLEVDFPMRKQQPPALRRQNEELMQRYRVQGFPTIVLLDERGRQLQQLGYIPGGPAAFIAALPSASEQPGLQVAKANPTAPVNDVPQDPVTASGTTGGRHSKVDESKLDALAAKHGEKLDWRRSVVDLMKVAGMDSSLRARSALADELDYTGPRGSAAMNARIRERVMQKIAGGAD